MIRLTAYVSGRIQRVGYRAKVVSLAHAMNLVGLVQNRSDGKVLVIAEGEQSDLEKFASALRIKNAIIDIENIDAQYSQGSGQYSSFKKITGPEEVGERLDDGIELLKGLVVGFNKMLEKQDSMLEKQDSLLVEVKDINQKLDRVLDKDIIELKSDMAEVKAALKAKGII